MQQDLDKTSELLKVLQRTQRERLTAKLTPAQPLPYAPSEAEHKLGKKSVVITIDLDALLSAAIKLFLVCLCNKKANCLYIFKP